MKVKKLLALTLALILALSCMSITAFADSTTELSETLSLSGSNYGNYQFTGGTLIKVFCNTPVESASDANDLSKTSLTVTLPDSGQITTKTHHVTKVVVNGTNLALTTAPANFATISDNTYTATKVMSGIIISGTGIVTSVTMYYAPKVLPKVSFTAATTTPDFVAETAGTYTVGSIASENFSGTVSYTAKVYTAATGTDEATGITAAVDGTAIKVTTTATTAQGTYYIGVKGAYNSENDELDTRIPFTVYGAFLDLDEDATYSDTKSGIDQTYTATVSTPKTDKTKVQVSWKLEDITVTVTNNKVWNTETLTWDPDTSKTNGAAASDPTAEFGFVNLSSKDVYAKLTFAKDSGITTEPTKAFTDNEETAGAGDGIIKLGNKATDSTTDNTGKIKLALTVTDSDFDAITSDTTGTYGTYTVKISAKDPTEYTITFDKQDGTGGTDFIKVVSGEKLTAITPPTKDGYTFEGYFAGTGDTDPMWYIEDGTPNITDPITADKTLYARWTAK